MNLSKCFATGLCLTAMTVSATVFKENSFEASEAGTGWTFDGTKNWDSSGVRVANDATRDSYSGGRPFASAANAQVLKLDTEGSVWTNAVVGASFPNNGNTVYSDMLVKFVPSEELPTIGSDVKLAVAVLVGTPNKLAISVINQDTYAGSTNVWIVTEGAIDTNAWTRLTIEMGNMGGSTAYANVKTNGALVNVDPYYVNQTDLTLNSIGFSGTGFIDEVVVRSDDPIQTAILLTLNFAAGIDSVYVGGTAKTTGQTVTSPAELVITASQWKEIASLTGPGTITWVDGGIGSSVATVTVANASATNVTITAQTSTSSALITEQNYFNGQPLNKVATWALANGVTELSNGIYDKYLFNIDDAATVPTMLITGISISGSTVTVTVTAGTSNLKTGINGTLKIKSYATLGATPTVRTISFVGETTDTITCDIGTDNFVKAIVE